MVVAGARQLEGRGPRLRVRRSGWHGGTATGVRAASQAARPRQEGSRPPALPSGPPGRQQRHPAQEHRSPKQLSSPASSVAPRKRHSVTAAPAGPLLAKLRAAAAAGRAADGRAAGQDPRPGYAPHNQAGAALERAGHAHHTSPTKQLLRLRMPVAMVRVMGAVGTVPAPVEGRKPLSPRRWVGQGRGLTAGWFMPSFLSQRWSTIPLATGLQGCVVRRHPPNRPPDDQLRAVHPQHVALLQQRHQQRRRARGGARHAAAERVHRHLQASPRRRDGRGGRGGVLCGGGEGGGDGGLWHRGWGWALAQCKRGQSQCQAGAHTVPEHADVTPLGRTRG